VTWASGINPAGQSVTIPSDATAVYVFWGFDVGSPAGLGMASCTLAGASANETIESAFEATSPIGGLRIFYNPPTGSQTLDVAWDVAPDYGPTTIVAFVKDGNTSAARDIDANVAAAGNANTVTLTTESGDLVLKYDQHYDTDEVAPALSASWTNAQTTGNLDEAARLSYISASGTTQVCDSENESYSLVVAVAISAGGIIGPPSLIKEIWRGIGA
jgi:hypothetical protein